MSSLQPDESQLAQRWEVVARQLYAAGSSLYFPLFLPHWIKPPLTSQQNKCSFMVAQSPRLPLKLSKEKEERINKGLA